MEASSTLITSPCFLNYEVCTFLTAASEVVLTVCIPVFKNRFYCFGLTDREKSATYKKPGETYTIALDKGENLLCMLIQTNFNKLADDVNERG